MSNRAVLALTVAAGLLLTAGCAGPPGQEVSGDLSALALPGQAAGFDLVLITLDTVRADRLGCYGHADAETPVLDRLAASGIRFEQTLATTPLTLPSHASIMTGLYPPVHGARDNGYYSLEGEAETLAEILGRSGYATAAFVSAYVLDRRYGLDQGFEHYDDSVRPSAPGEIETGYNQRPADEVTDQALEWMRSHLDRAEPTPYFLWVHYFDAHWPTRPPPPFAERFSESPYDGEIAFIDSELGRIVKELEKRSRLERTLFVVTADHGEGLDEHGERAHSLFIYDSTMRVPWIVSNPAIFDEGLVVRDRVASIVDILPASLDLLGVPFDEALDGVDPFRTPFDPDRAVYLETLSTLVRHGFAPLHGLRRIQDKLILAPRPEYYDLESDPGETTNLFEREPAGALELQRRLEARLEDWEQPEAALLRALRLDPEEAERLAALGYVEARVEPSAGADRGDPKDLVPVWRRVEQAQTLSHQDKHEEAVGEITEVVTLLPDEPLAWRVAALIYNRAGRPDRAEEALRRGLELRRSAEAHVRLARLLLRRGDREGCAAELDLAQELDPQDGASYITRGDLYAVSGEFERAVEQFREAERIDPIRAGGMARKKIAEAEARLNR